jgi:3-oxoacyl-[acyl-carrier-protein] synthase-1
MLADARREVWMVGLGARCALGASAVAAGAAYRAGIARHALHPTWISRSGEPAAVAADPLLPLDVPLVPRLVDMAVDAARQAVSSVAARLPAVDVLAALPEPRPGVRQGAAERVVAALREALAADVALGEVVAVPGGRTAGIVALARAVSRIRAGQSEACLWCGADSWLAPATLEALDLAGRLHIGRAHYGMIPGEAGAACLLLASGAAERLGLSPLGAVLSAEVAEERSLPEEGAVCTGEGLSAATRRAIRPLGLEQKIVSTVSDLNGERERVDEVGFTTTRIADRLGDGQVLATPATRLGDVGAAFAPLAAGLVATAAQRGRAAGRHVLLWTSGPGARRGAALLDAPVGERE